MVGIFNRLFVGREKLNQYAALPYRMRGGRHLEIALVTSRETKRWIIPKGWPEAALTPWDTAANEAFEEAGLRGTIADKPIGHYTYLKRLHLFSSIVCQVDVFPLKVEEEFGMWPEASDRQRVWLAPARAAEKVEEPQLRALIDRFAASQG